MMRKFDENKSDLSKRRSKRREDFRRLRRRRRSEDMIEWTESTPCGRDLMMKMMSSLGGIFISHPIRWMDQISVKDPRRKDCVRITTSGCWIRETEKVLSRSK
jgi:hypothetical protein